jgi:hypothetical protein
MPRLVFLMRRLSRANHDREMVSKQRGTPMLRLAYDHEGRVKYGYSTTEPANRFDPAMIARDVPDRLTERIAG